MRRLAGLLAIAALLSCVPDPQAPLFNFAHVEGALRYFEEPSHELLRAIAATEASRHLKAHSDWAGYYPTEASTDDITEDLIAEGEPPAPSLRGEVAALIAYVRDNPSLQAACMAEADRYLPEQRQGAPPLFATWGYDIGVASPMGASLNFAHPHFLEKRQEIWFYCVHELHHVGVLRQHHPAPLAEVQTVGDLRALIRFLTMLEGSAVYAARDMRARMNALDDDEDYQALADTARMERISARYEELAGTLDQRPADEPLVDSDWITIEELSGGERLWYRHGARMAMAIERELGIEALRNLLAEGPDAFFAAYAEAQRQQQ